MAGVTIHNLAGVTLATVNPVPAVVSELKGILEEQTGVPRGLQKLVDSSDSRVYTDTDELDISEEYAMILVRDETLLWTWDFEGNPNADQLQVEGNVVKCPQLRNDYVNVLTKEPIRHGIHYFEFIMHRIGDEQSCGLVSDPSHAGARHGLRRIRGWTYYVGRMSSTRGSIRDGMGALHAEGKAVKEFKKLNREGDVIGMLIDKTQGAVAFSLNGEIQGACAVPQDPLWILTHVDTRSDHVELRKPCLEDAPPAHLEALKGALIDITEGMHL